MLASISLRWSLALVLLLGAFGPGCVRPALVAYYNFDTAISPGGVQGQSGYCPNVVADGRTRGTAAVTSSECWYGDCLRPGTNGSMILFQKVFQSSATANAFSFSFWMRLNGTYPPPSYLIFHQSLLHVVHHSGGFTGALYSITRSFTPTFVQLSITLTPYVYHHVVASYDGNQFCIYVNNTVASGCVNAPGEKLTETSAIEIGSVTWLPQYTFTGTIDELKIYDHALSAGERSLLSSAIAPNDAPSVQFHLNGTELGSSYSTQAFTNITLSIAVNDSRKAFSGGPQGVGYENILTYKWEALSSTCDGVRIRSPTSRTTMLSLDDISVSTVKACVSDGEISREATFSLSASASVPQIIRQPSSPVIVVPAGAVDFAISVEGSSLPAPSYQWQVLANVTVNRTTGPDNVTARSFYEEDDYMPEEALDALYMTRMMISRGMAERELIEFEDFVAIPNATFNTLFLNGTDEWDAAVIRCLLYTSGGSKTTNNFTIMIGSPQSPTPGGSDSNAALIGGIVGGVGGGILLCILLLAVVAVLIVASRRRSSAYRELQQPDYEAVAFGDVKGDVSLPKKQAEEYRQLEQMLGNPDHLLASAICGVADMSDRDTVYRALIRVLQGQAQAYNFIARAIAQEVDIADEEGTLFRSNSAAAKLFTFHMRTICLRYLWHVLVLSVHTLNDNAIDIDGRSTRAGASQVGSSRVFGNKYRVALDDLDDDNDSSSMAMDILGASSMELDPQKLDDASDLDINTLELWLTAQKMLKLIMHSEKSMPQELRMLIRRINNEVADKFSEEAVYRAMGGFFFLRLICPALLAPQLHGLLEQPPHPTAQRQLILLTKVLQNLANDTLPGAKEAYMERLNVFITSNKPALSRFYDQIVEHPERGRPTDITVPQRVRNDSLIKLRTFLEANSSKIEQYLREKNEEEAEEIIAELRLILHKDGRDQV